MIRMFQIKYTDQLGKPRASGDDPDSFGTVIICDG